jgi:hypothetical protein
METSERGIGRLFGLVGGALIVIGGVVAAVFGVVNAALGYGLASIVSAWSEAILLFVVGGLVLLFTHLAGHEWKDRAVSTGVVLIVLAFVGWAILGLGSNLVALVGGLFALLAGILYLVEPTQRAARALTASS